METAIDRLVARHAVRGEGANSRIYLEGACLDERPLVHLRLSGPGVDAALRIGTAPPAWITTPPAAFPGCGFRFFGAFPEDVTMPWPFRMTGTFSDGTLVVLNGHARQFDDSPTPLSAGRFAVRSSRVSSAVRVATVAHRPGVGGAQWWLSTVRENMRARSGVTVSEFGSHSCADNDTPTISHGLWCYTDSDRFEAAVTKLQVALIAFNPDVVLVNTVEGVVAAEATRRAGIPLVWAIHESYSPADLWASVFGLDTVPGSLARALLDCFAYASRVLFVSQATAALFDHVVNQAAVRVVPFDVSSLAATPETRKKRRTAVRSEFGIPADRVVACCVGTLEERKNLVPLLVAFSEAWHEWPALHLVIAGPATGDYPLLLERCIERLGIERQVTLVNAVVDTNDVLDASDILVSASDIESRPVVVLEAISRGVAVLAADVCGLDEVIEPARTGILCARRDTRGLRDGLIRLGRSPALRDAVASAATRSRKQSFARWPGDVVDEVLLSMEP